MSVVKVKKRGSHITGMVLVLLSSYNGEKYISEQLESLLNQTIPVFILIRDDGSTDNTVSIINEFIKKYDNIKLITGNNIGFFKSFNALIFNKTVDEFEYIAFCDQDDVWLPEKLEKALLKIKENYNSQIPFLYFSNMTLTDENLKKYGYRNKRSLKVTPYSALVNCPCAGCTMVFNNSAVKLYRIGEKGQMPFHDYHMLCVCLFMGRVIYDHNTYILYRQHDHNTIGMPAFMSIKQGLSEAVCDIFKSHGGGEKILWFKSFLTNYNRYLNRKDKGIIKKFSEHSENLLYRIILFLDPRYVSSFREDKGIKITLSFKFRILINRMI